jgi:hypothetical protein
VQVQVTVWPVCVQFEGSASCAETAPATRTAHKPTIAAITTPASIAPRILIAISDLPARSRDPFAPKLSPEAIQIGNDMEVL